ncbi:MAG: hypothetical protein ACJATE_001311 [Bacteroidia bacterium]|jgi:hypothetical protein
MRLNFQHIISLFLLTFLLLSGCTLQKRKHLPGYSVEWNNKKTDRPKHKKETTSKKHFVKIKNIVTENYIEPGSEASGGIETNVFARNIYKVLAKSMMPPSTKDSCDNLITKEADEIRCKIVEVGIDVIKYKKCGFEDGPLFSIPRSTVWMIMYTNGDTDVIKDLKPASEPVYVSQTNATPRKRLDVMGLVGFCLTIASIVPWWLVSAIIGFIAGILGIIFGIISIVRISRRRESRKGLGFAIVSLILGVLLVAATLIVWAAIGVI